MILLPDTLVKCENTFTCSTGVVHVWVSFVSTRLIIARMHIACEGDSQLLSYLNMLLNPCRCWQAALVEQQPNQMALPPSACTCQTTCQGSLTAAHLPPRLRSRRRGSTSACSQPTAGARTMHHSSSSTTAAAARQWPFLAGTAAMAGCQSL